MDLSKILNLVYRYLWLLILAGLIAGLTTFFQLSDRPVTYRATTDLLIGPGLDSPSPDLNSLKIGGQLGQTYAEVLNTDSFLESVNNKLDQKMDLITLKDALSTRQSTETRVLTIIVFYPDPQQAVAIANAAAQTLLEMSPSQDNITASLRARMIDQSHQLEQIVSESQSKIQQLEAELGTLNAANTSSPEVKDPSGSQSKIQQLEAELATLKAAKPVYPEAIRLNLEQQNLILRELTDERSRLPEAEKLVITELADERSRLSDALRTLSTIYQILLDTDTNKIEIIQPATTATSVDQQLWLRIISSGVGGLIFALILIFVAEYFDDRLRFPGDLSKAAGVPLLSTINRYPSRKGSGLEQLVTLAQPESDAANRYREVVAKLLFSIDRSIPSTLLVSSVGSKTGTDAAMTAGNLAVAFAQADYKVALVDTQVNNPVLTSIFKAEKKEGLADLMITKSTAPQLLTVEQVPGIRFLPDGLSYEKGSHTMLKPTNVTTLLERLQQEADIVLVAGPAISQFAENLTLASQANAVVLVAHHAEARSKVVNKVVQSFRLMKINLVGVIFDYNPPPFISKDDRRISALERGTRTQGNLSEQTTES